MTDEETAAHINKICNGPNGLSSLPPVEARLVAASVFANTMIATGWDFDEAFVALGKTVAITQAHLPRLRRAAN